MLLTGQNIYKEYGIKTVLDITKLEIEEGDRIGLIGRNGAGKSTLFGILSGRIQPDSGNINCRCEISELMQSGSISQEEQYQCVSDTWYENKSGGERMRKAVSEAFTRNTPLLLADEPTTNLDASGIQMLEKLLLRYRGAVVMISHDRELLDRTCNKIWELNEGKLKVFHGNYSAWYEEKQKQRQHEKSEYDKYTAKQKQLKKHIAALKQEAAGMEKRPRKMSNSEWQLYKGINSQQQGHVQARVTAVKSRLENMEVREKPKEEIHVSMKLPDNRNIKSRIAVNIVDFSARYHNQKVLEHVSLQIHTGEKVFFCGDNGSGKSTLLNAIVNGAEGIFVASDAKIGYFSQTQDHLDWDKNVLANVISTAVVPEHVCRAVLRNLCMSNEDMTKNIPVLSGGERVKTALAKVLVSGSNLLVLDEPTNHCDIETMEGLETLLSGYNGTAIIVTHDRRFMNKLADQCHMMYTITK